MTIPNWIIGLLFVVLVVVQLFWAADLIVSTVATAIHRGCWHLLSRPRFSWPDIRRFLVSLWTAILDFVRQLARSGSFWLGVYNLTTSVLHGWFVLIVFREPGRQQSVAISLLIASMVLPAALAWHFLRHPARTGGTWKS